jgi:hypothetical protein
MTRMAGLVLGVALAVVLGGCADGTADAAAGAAGTEVGARTASSASSPRDLLVRTRDHVFDAPARVASGATRIRLVNEGPDFHHVWLIRLEAGRTVEELERALAERPVTPDWAVDVGGPNTPGAAGEETSAVVQLEPGLHALVCVIPGPDGVPHIMKGMTRALVVERDGAEPSLPPAELVMTMDDYGYRLSAPIRAGRRSLRVENVAAQAHEVLIVKLEKGKRAEDFLQFLAAPEGTPPGKPVGGTTGLSRGQTNVISVDFEPGTYAFLCFVHDAGDLKPHFMHGMMQTFEVT